MHVIITPCTAFVVVFGAEDRAQDLGLHRQAPTTEHSPRPLLDLG